MQIKKTEKQLIRLYEESIRKENNWSVQQAREIIKEILQAFHWLDVFINSEHTQIVKRLYFNRLNIERIGIRAMTFRVFVPERTLYKYRQKYCLLIAEILKESERICSSFGRSIFVFWNAINSLAGFPSTPFGAEK